MAIKKISQFTSGTPTASDKILFEQNGAGRSATIDDLLSAKKISEFTSGTPIETDKILFEHDGIRKSAPFNNLPIFSGIDMANILGYQIELSNTTTYTATVDCYIVYRFSIASTDNAIIIDGEYLVSNYSTASNLNQIGIIPIKKGQVIKSKRSGCTINVFAIKR